MLTTCYLCSKPKVVQKLFRKCKHDSACRKCLRKMYIEDAQTVYCYPLECFHPDCQRLLRDEQMRTLREKSEEFDTYYKLSKSAKIKRSALGDHWKQACQILEAMEGYKICQCPKCRILITKDGGCDHMQCINCCHTFSWNTASEILEEKLNYLYPKKLSITGHEKSKKNLPLLNLDDEIEMHNASNCFKEDDYYSVYSDESESFLVQRRDFVRSNFIKEIEWESPKNNGAVPKEFTTIGVSVPLKEKIKDRFETDSLKEENRNEYLVEKKSDLYKGKPKRVKGAKLEKKWAEAEERRKPNIPAPHFASTQSSTIGDMESEASQHTSIFEGSIIEYDGFDQEWEEVFCYLDSELESGNHASSSPTDGWEEVSEISFVKTFASKSIPSFLEAARSNAIPCSSDSRQRSKLGPLKAIQEVFKPHLGFQKTADQTLRNLCDPFFEYEGLKSARGGKEKYMYKHQPSRRGCKSRTKWRRWCRKHLH